MTRYCQKSLSLLAGLLLGFSARAGLDIADVPTFVTEVLPPNVIISPIYRDNASEVSMMDLPWEVYFKCSGTGRDASVCYSSAGDAEAPNPLLTTGHWTSGAPFLPSQMWRVTPWPKTTQTAGGQVYSLIDLYPGDRDAGGGTETIIPLYYFKPKIGGARNEVREEIYPEAGSPYYVDANKGKLAYIRSDKNFLYFNKPLADRVGYRKWPDLGGYTFSGYSTVDAARTPYYNPLKKQQSGVDITADLAATEAGWIYQNASGSSSQNLNRLIGQYNVYTPTSGQESEVWRSTNYLRHTWTGSSPNNMTDADKLNFAHWFTYWRSSYLATRGILGNLVNTLKTRDLLDRFRIGIYHYDASGRKVVNVMAPVGETKAAKSVDLETRLARIIYDFNTDFTQYKQNDVVDYYKTYAAYRDDPTDTRAAATGARSCRRNYEIMITPDYTRMGVQTEKTVAINGASGEKLADYDGDGHASLWGDVGAYGYLTDLTDLPNTLLPGTRDQATHQHLVRYLVGPQTKGRWFNSTLTTPAAADQIFQQKTTSAWNELGQNQDYLYDADDLWHMALNSRGFFYNSSDVNAAVANMLNAFNDILLNNTTGSAVATNTTSLSQGGQIYQATVENNWRGHLLSYQVSRTTNNAGRDVLNINYGTPLWDLANKLSIQAAQPDTRNVITFSKDTNSGVPFVWGSVGNTLQGVFTSSLTEVLPTTTIPDGERAAVAAKIFNYLRGDVTCEDGAATLCRLSDGATQYTFRRRSLVRGNTSPFAINTSKDAAVDNGNTGGRNVLGDIANSSPWYVLQPQMDVSDVDYPGYNAFRISDRVKNRPGMIYVGANDGMLHAVRVSDGAELFAYVPSFVHNNLPLLASKSYSHKFYVDGSPFSAEVDLEGDGTGWTTVLAGGANKGGKGYYLLDITSPTDFTQANAATKVLWEFTSNNIGADDQADLHYTYNIPAAMPDRTTRTGQARQIVRLNTAAGQRAKWALIVGNGYPEASSQRACLFIIYLNSRPGESNWVPGTHYRKLCAGARDYTGRAKGLDTNGLSSPTPLDLDGNGTADVVYAGDLNGNIWRFDIKSADPAQWEVGLQAEGSTCSSDPNTCVPLFVSRDRTGKRQPVIAPPEVTFFSKEHIGGQLVFWGTGKLLGNVDRGDASQQSYYAVWDRSAPSVTTYMLNNLDRSNLTARTFTLTNQNVGTVASPSWLATRTQATRTVLSYCSTVSLDACGGNVLGWYWDMDESGERLTGRSSLIDGVVFFNTLVPSLDASGGLDPCAYGGTGWLMGLDALNGNMTDFPVFDLNMDGVIDSADDAHIAAGVRLGAAIGGTTFTQGIGTTKFGVYAPTNLGTAASEGDKMKIIIDTGSANRGRVSWYELLDD